MSNLLGQWLAHEAKQKGMHVKGLESKEGFKVHEIVEKYNLTSRRRYREVAYLRFYFSWHLHEHLHFGTSEIARLINRDHASVHHGIKEAKYYMEKSDKVFTRITLDIRIDMLTIKRPK